MNRKYFYYFPFLLAFFILSASSSYAQGDVGIQATVDNDPPTINITNPNSKDTVSGIVNVTATATDDGGVVKVEFFIDGLLKQTDTTAPYTFSWDTQTVSNGSHTITAKAYDIVNNTAADTITVTVDNVTMTSPTKKITPLAPITPVPEKPTGKKEEEKRKFLIFPNLPGIGLAEAPIDFFKAYTNFFYGFLFALELLIVFFLIKKIRERKKKEKNQQGNTPTAPPSPPKTNLFKS